MLLFNICSAAFIQWRKQKAKKEDTKINEIIIVYMYTFVYLQAIVCLFESVWSICLTTYYHSHTIYRQDYALAF